MSHITADELKSLGVSAIEAALKENTSAIISDRGKVRYVVMELEHYQHLRECELEAALARSRADIQAGRFVIESARQHVARVKS